MTISTPPTPSEPVLRTIIQFDGDIQNVIFCSVEEPDSDVPQDIVDAHLAAMRKRISRIAVWQNRASLAGQTAQGLTFTGWVSAILGAFVWHSSLSGLALEVAACAVPAALRYSAPFVIDALIKRVAHGAAVERDEDNKRELGRLRAWRSGGVTS